MRSKYSIWGMVALSFFMVIAFQNCSDVSEMTSTGDMNNNFGPNPDGGGIVTCLAIPLPTLELGFVFSSNSPSSVALDINDELTYSSCEEAYGHASLHRTGARLEFRKVYESINEMPMALDLKLYQVNCSNNTRSLITHIIEAEPDYQPYSLCRKNSIKLKVDYLVNE